MFKYIKKIFTSSKDQFEDASKIDTKKEILNIDVIDIGPQKNNANLQFNQQKGQIIKKQFSPPLSPTYQQHQKVEEKDMCMEDDPVVDFEQLQKEQQQKQFQDLKIQEKGDIEIEQIQKQPNENMVSSFVSVEIRPRQKVCKLFPDQTANLPVLISLKTLDVKGEQGTRAPVDLVCVVDNSGSMGSGNKIEHVKKSLLYLMKILKENDRICIITFSTSSKLIVPFLRNNEANKQRLKKAIKSIQATNSTNIASGMEMAFKMLLERKQKNPISSVFLLSDGQDDNKGTEERIRQLLQIYSIKDNFVIHTFGYGSDYDSSVMDAISLIKQGHNYYIKEVENVAEYFIMALSGLLSVCAETVTITVKTINVFNPNTQIAVSEKVLSHISKLYGEQQVWKKNPFTGDYEIKIPYLLYGKEKEYLLELEFEPFKEDTHHLTDLTRTQPVLEVQFSAKSIMNQQQQQQQYPQQQFLQNDSQKQQKEQQSQFMQWAQTLDMTFLAPTEQVNDMAEDPKVEINFLIAKGADCLLQAKQCADQRMYQAGEKILNDYIDMINNSPYKDDAQLTKVKLDCVKSKGLCKADVYEQEGEKFMQRKQRNLISRSASRSNSGHSNNRQASLKRHFQGGDLNLSVCSKNDQRDEDEDLGKFQLPGRTHSRQRSLSADYKRMQGRKGRSIDSRNDSNQSEDENSHNYPKDFNVIPGYVQQQQQIRGRSLTRAITPDKESSANQQQNQSQRKNRFQPENPFASDQQAGQIESFQQKDEQQIKDNQQ